MQAPEKVAAKIVGEEIRLLTELQEMAGNPRIFSFMCQIVDAARNGNGNGSKSAKPASPDQKSETPSSARNGLTREVLGFCQRMEADITVAKVVESMTADKYEFVAQQPKVAVADVIRRYTGTKLKITKRGEGNQPHIYKWTGGQDEQA